MPAVFDRFMAELMTLARANDFPVAKDREDAELEAFARQVASPHAAEDEAGRFRIDGPTAYLTPKAALALALHELATNAAKYGALSTPVGGVALTWDASDREGPEGR